MRVCIQIRQNEHGLFVACCPSLPGCVSTGQTEQQAKSRLEEAIRGYLASLHNFVPERIQHVVEYS